MISLALVLLLQAKGQEPEASPQRLVYRWKTPNGQVNVTTSLPPLNAVVLETLIIKDAEDALPGDADASPMPSHEAFRQQMESVMADGTVDYWHSIDNAFLLARQSGNVSESNKTVDKIFRGALWGDRLWLLALLPIVALAIPLLFAWWASIGLSALMKKTVLASVAALGLFMFHIGLHKALYGPQAKRLEFALSMAPNYLGGHVQAKLGDQQAMAAHADALQKAAGPIRPPWAFPMEIHRARRALRHAATDT
jgi:hypothetical protein